MRCCFIYMISIYLIKNETEKAITYVNLAIEIDPNIIRYIEQDDTFNKILGKVKSQSQKEIKTKVSEKEIEIIEHLEKTYDVVERLTDDMQIQDFEKER